MVAISSNLYSIFRLYVVRTFRSASIAGLKACTTYNRKARGDRMRVLFLMMMLTVLTAAVPRGQEPLWLSGAIELPSVDGRIDHLAFDAAAQRLFVAALGNNTVEVLDVKNNRHLRSLPGFREPQGIAVAAAAKA